MKKLITILLSFTLIISTLGIAITASAEGNNAISITTDGSFSVGSCDKLSITGAKASVTLDNAQIIANNKSAIEITGNSQVVLILAGKSTVSGNPNTESCGIYVEHGSSLTIEGDGTLNVTGGKYGAAIGSYGTTTNLPVESRLKVGEITVNSGTIIAKGGDRGSGIGSGYHVNGNIVTINGGNVYAYGAGGGAGIGSGYGTSGGAAPIAAVGNYDSGSVIINGGNVYAASFDVDFAGVNYLEPSTYSDKDKYSFAAGIGGGYGASASDIQISGGKVVAIGSCGGAGIGGGRGTSKAQNYDIDAYKVNVSIHGNADVTAIANDDYRNMQGGGAAIGSGRGSHTGGNIAIDGKAKVLAVASPFASAIGAASSVSPVDKSIPTADSIAIGDNVTLYAVASGHVAVDNAKQLSVGESIKYNNDIPTGTTSVKLDECEYTVPANSTSLWANASSSGASGEQYTVSVITPKKMSIRLEDGTVLNNGDSFTIGKDQELRFQMCSNNWDNDTYSDDNDNGVAGTVVYKVMVSEKFDGRRFDESTNTFTLPKGDLVLRTDVNKCFMAYKYHFKKGDYNKQTGIAKVVNTPLESLSVNLPLGSTIVSDAYKAMSKIDTANVLVQQGEDKTLSYTDYYWNW